jgi:hypothetical protein
MPSTIGIVSSSVLEYITIEYLQIGGGGGGGLDAGGGGGAGGYVEGTIQWPLKQLIFQNHLPTKDCNDRVPFP